LLIIRQLESIREWSDIMKRSGRWNYKVLVAKAMLGLVLTIMAGSIAVVPSFADDDRRIERHDKGRYEQRGRGYDRDRRVYRSYGYRERDGYYDRRERVYPPPAVVFAPPPLPGIGIFFPPLFIR
jgi:hypothetical protein